MSTSESQSEGARIAVLCGGGPLPWIMVNAVIERFGPVTVIEEDKEPASVLVRRRMKMLGFVSTMGQVAFGLFLKLLQKTSAGRKRQIMSAAGLNPVPCENSTLKKVPSVNSEACRTALRQAAPEVVLVCGTRMIGEKTLSCLDAPFMNYHAGINPAYRGMNGGYWALAHADHINAGVTVHMVDKGVDTGGILYTAPFKPEPGDNFVTYPFLQAAAGKPLVIKAVEDALSGRLKTFNSELPSRQWFHPTLWQYFWYGLSRGVW